VRALLAMDRKADALRYAEDSKKIINIPISAVAKVCEDILLSSGFYEEAYKRYALDANQGTTHLATFRGLVKKYPHKPAIDILRDLVSSQPGSECKWFAAAKDVGLFDVAIELVNKSPTDPRTLIRASRDFAENRRILLCLLEWRRYIGWHRAMVIKLPPVMCWKLTRRF
jgi:hypothetical protein